MKNKNERLSAIRMMIGNEKFSSQEELLKILITKGFNMTQATLSRDLKYLKVAKMPDNEKGYFYMLQGAEPQVNEENPVRFSAKCIINNRICPGNGIDQNTTRICRWNSLSNRYYENTRSCRNSCRG